MMVAGLPELCATPQSLAATAASFRVRVVPHERAFHQRLGEIQREAVEQRIALWVHVEANTGRWCINPVRDKPEAGRVALPNPLRERHSELGHAVDHGVGPT